MSRVRGKVKWFKPEKGFGFIERQNGNDIFFHFKSLNMAGFKTIEAGKSVEFDMVDNPKGPEAKEIVVVSD